MRLAGNAGEEESLYLKQLAAHLRYNKIIFTLNCQSVSGRIASKLISNNKMDLGICIIF